MYFDLSSIYSNSGWDNHGDEMFQKGCLLLSITVQFDGSSRFHRNAIMSTLNGYTFKCKQTFPFMRISSRLRGIEIF